MISVNNFIKIQDVNIVLQKDKFFKLNIILEKPVLFHYVFYKDFIININLDWSSKVMSTTYKFTTYDSLKNYIFYSCKQGDYLYFSEWYTKPSQEEIWNLLSNINTTNIKLIETITNML